MMFKRISTPAGKVYLVGAGPGDPGLLTQRAVELLKQVDVVAYDALISPSILALIPPQTELLSVGYRGYGSSRLKHRMHPLVIDRALQGLSVMRLKSGDPWIFGRAGHECEELLENRIPFEVVPGITAGLGAAAYSGFPLTHKDLSSDVVLTSGHDLRGEFKSNSDWNALARACGTLVIYMAATKIKENCLRLIQMGRDPSTPAALIAEATRASQKIVTGTLNSLPGKISLEFQKLPAVMIVGETVSLRNQFHWLEEKPLHGLSLLLIRARTGRSKLSQLLRDQGAEVIEAPWIDTTELEDPLPLDSAIRKLESGHYTNLIFTCAEGVQYFWNRCFKLGLDIRKLSPITLTSLGPNITESLRKVSLIPDVQLSGHCYQAVQEHQETLRKHKNLVILSSRGRMNLQSFFSQAQIPGDFVPAYHYRSQFPKFDPPLVDFVILPSSTSAHLLLDASAETAGPNPFLPNALGSNPLWKSAYRNTPMVALGPITRQAALSLGATSVEQTEKDDITLVAPLLEKLRNFSSSSQCPLEEFKESLA